MSLDIPKIFSDIAKPLTDAASALDPTGTVKSLLQAGEGAIKSVFDEMAGTDQAAQVAPAMDTIQP